MNYSKYNLDDLFRLFYLTRDKSIQASIEAEIDSRNHTPEEIEKARGAIIAENLAKVEHRGLSTKEFMMIILMPFKKFVRKKHDFEVNLENYRDELLNRDIPDVGLAKIMGYALYMLLFLLIFAIWY